MSFSRAGARYLMMIQEPAGDGVLSGFQTGGASKQTLHRQDSSRSASHLVNMLTVQGKFRIRFNRELVQKRMYFMSSVGREAFYTTELTIKIYFCNMLLATSPVVVGFIQRKCFVRQSLTVRQTLVQSPDIQPCPIWHICGSKPGE